MPRTIVVEEWLPCTMWWILVHESGIDDRNPCNVAVDLLSLALFVRVCAGRSQADEENTGKLERNVERISKEVYGQKAIFETEIWDLTFENEVIWSQSETGCYFSVSNLVFIWAQDIWSLSPVSVGVQHPFRSLNWSNGLYLILETDFFFRSLNFGLNWTGFAY